MGAVMNPDMITDERMRLLSDAYAGGRITITQLEAFAEQAARGEQPRDSLGFPVIADPALYSWR